MFVRAVVHRIGLRIKIGYSGGKCTVSFWGCLQNALMRESFVIQGAGKTLYQVNIKQDHGIAS
jgi:hypothetical protein